MPGCRCAVSGCSNSRIITKSRGEDIVYHRFPKAKDAFSIKIHNEWVARCKKPHVFNSATSLICSIHFTEDDYQRDLRNELLGLPIRKILRKTAVPTLNLPPTNMAIKQKKNKDGTGTKRSFKKERSITVDEVMKDTTNTVSHDCTVDTNYEFEFVEVTCLQTKYDQLLADFESLQNELQEERECSKRKIKSLTVQLNYYKKKYLDISKNLIDSTRQLRSKNKPTRKRKMESNELEDCEVIELHIVT